MYKPNYITPSQATARLKRLSINFVSIIADEYEKEPYKKKAINRFVREFNKIDYLCSIAKFNRNKETTKSIIDTIDSQRVDMYDFYIAHK